MEDLNAVLPIGRELVLRYLGHNWGIVKIVQN